MIWGYHYFRKHPYLPFKMLLNFPIAVLDFGWVHCTKFFPAVCSPEHGGPNHFAWTRPGMMLQVGTFLLKIVGLPSFKINCVFFKTSEMVPTWFKKKQRNASKKVEAWKQEKGCHHYFCSCTKSVQLTLFFSMPLVFHIKSNSTNSWASIPFKGQILPNFHPFHSILQPKTSIQ